MAKILVVDDTLFWREIAGDGLRRNGHTVATACNGLDALQSLRSAGADLVVLDVEMPGMEGLSFLEQLRQKNEWKSLPVIMLTGDMHKEHVLQAKKLGAVDYLLKARFSLPELLSRVDRGLASAAAPASPAKRQSQPAAPPKTAPQQPVPAAATGLPRLLTREQCIARAESAISGRNNSLAVTDVIALAGSPRADLSELASLLGRDPLLSARVLHASSRAAHHAGRGAVTTLQEAVRLLGCATIRDIAVSVGVFDTMPAPAADGFDPIRSWQHSLAVAKICGMLAPAELSGTAHVIGLCHDLGEILFRTHFEPEYTQVLQAQAACGKPLHELERSMLGLTHGQLVQTILRCMKLPDAVARPIADFHDAIAAGNHPAAPLGRILHMADLYATGILLAPSVQSLVRPLTRVECRNAVSADDPPLPDSSAIRNEIYTMTALYARPSRDARTNVTEPLLPRRPLRLILAREPGLSSFDPLAAALDSLAEVTLRQSMPLAEDLADHHALVVLTRTDALPGFTATDVATAATRSDGTRIPTLWLAGKCGDATPAGQDLPKPSHWPVSLDMLARFVAGLAPAVAQAA